MARGGTSSTKTPQRSYIQSRGGLFVLFWLCVLLLLLLLFVCMTDVACYKQLSDIMFVFASSCVWCLVNWCRVWMRGVCVCVCVCVVVSMDG